MGGTLATPCPVLHEALAVWHPHPRAAGSIGSYLSSPVPRSHEGEAQLSSVWGLEGRWRSTRPGCPGCVCSALPTASSLHSPCSL
uniref:Uncharacterized protein n=1 Tax=Balaenoptera musculus TaxID=9771 RepID=A0A8C0DFX2_BALMU